MASLLETIRNLAGVSIHGRRLKITHDDYLVGPKALREQVQDFTSASTGTAIPAYGVASIQCTTLSTQAFVLSNPIPGVAVTIFQTHSGATNLSSGITLKRPSTAFYIESTEGSTNTTINMSSRGSITLLGLTTALYQVKTRSESTANINLNGTT